jgi:hypothetical protein
MTDDALIRKVPVVLQSCSMSEVVQLGPFNKTIVTSPDSADNVIVMNYEDSTGVNTYGQLIPVPISYPPIMVPQDEVSYVSLCLFLDIFPQYPEMPAVLCCLHLLFCLTTFMCVVVSVITTLHEKFVI